VPSAEVAHDDALVAGLHVWQLLAGFVSPLA
jgi:hypothetical protein